MTELNSKNIKQYLESDEYQFKIFDIPYTQKEKNCIDSFDLKLHATYDNYGDNNLEDLNNFLIQLGNNSDKKIKTMCNIIKKILKIVMTGYQKESYWLTIRVTKPTNDWDLPRWHCDGNYFLKTGERKIVSKFATALQGSGTLLLKTSNDAQRKKFIDISEAAYQVNLDYISEQHREYINNNILGDIIKITNYQSVIFISGPREICGIHSEPEMHTSRMFISIVPGSKKEIEGWHNKKGGGTRNEFEALPRQGSFSNYISNKKDYLNLKLNILALELV